MSGVVANELRQPGAEPAASEPTRLRRAAADFWLDAFFRLAPRAPAVTRALRPLIARGAYRCSPSIRAATAANARRILGPDATSAQAHAFGRGVVSSFFDFVCDIAQSLHFSREQLLARIDAIEGHDRYLAARSARRGAIIATAHLGSFEAGVAALLEHEKTMHVVFKRDASRFEQVRSALRGKLGVVEQPVNDGWGMWLRLRDALGRDEVVMIQADRVMPGQKGVRVPFLHGHLLLPSGPIKLAIASGAPIIPVFAIRAPNGRIRIHVEDAIIAHASDESPHPALLQFARILEQYVRAFPQQWLLLQNAFCEDSS
ncbi:MAG: lysophospholipid acyltransferase family protein [Tepidisphaeraceae bacterium]